MIENYVVLKIPHKEVVQILSECTSVPRSFSQKYNGIWSPNDYPYLVLGLVYQKQEKQFWALVFSKYRSSINFTNIPRSKCIQRNLCIFVITSFLAPNKYLREGLFSKLAQFFVKACISVNLSKLAPKL